MRTILRVLILAAVVVAGKRPRQRRTVLVDT